MSLRIDDYLSSIESLSTLTATQPGTATSAVSANSSQEDSYISSIGSSDDVSVSDTYNDFAYQMLKNTSSSSSASASASDSTSASASASAPASDSASASSAASTSDTSSSSQASGGSSGSDSSSDSDTTTQVETINGITYLVTTTSENGVETTTRTVISKDGDGSKNSASDLSAMI